MACKITINVESNEDLSLACEEVAKEIDKGNVSGILGFSVDTWSVEKE